MPLRVCRRARIGGWVALWRPVCYRVCASVINAVLLLGHRDVNGEWCRRRLRVPAPSVASALLLIGCPYGASGPDGDVPVLAPTRVPRAILVQITDGYDRCVRENGSRPDAAVRVCARLCARRAGHEIWEGCCRSTTWRKRAGRLGNVLSLPRLGSVL